MTQAELARALGVSPQTYNAWEKDISNVAIGKVMSIADFFRSNNRRNFFTVVYEKYSYKREYKEEKYEYT